MSAWPLSRLLITTTRHGATDKATCIDQRSVTSHRTLETVPDACVRITLVEAIIPQTASLPTIAVTDNAPNNSYALQPNPPAPGSQEPKPSTTAHTEYDCVTTADTEYRIQSNHAKAGGSLAEFVPST